MRQYWINQNGNQSGPHTLEDLQQMKMDKKTYVWFSGMSDWKRVKDVPELAYLLETAEQTAEQAPVPPVYDSEPVPVENPQEEESIPVEEPETSDVVVEDTEVNEPETPAVEDEDVVYVEDPAEEEQPAGVQPPEYVAPQPPAAPQNYVPQYNPQPTADATVEEIPECPPTNLIAAIVCTVLCCTPVGIVGIVLACMVKSKWRAGDYKKAQKYSDWSAWMVILSIVLTILALPVSFLLIH